MCIVGAIDPRTSPLVEGEVVSGQQLAVAFIGRGVPIGILGYYGVAHCSALAARLWPAPLRRWRPQVAYPTLACGPSCTRTIMSAPEAGFTMGACVEEFEGAI